MILRPYHLRALSHLPPLSFEDGFRCSGIRWACSRRCYNELIAWGYIAEELPECFEVNDQNMASAITEAGLAAIADYEAANPDAPRHYYPAQDYRDHRKEAQKRQKCYARNGTNHGKERER